MGNQVYALEWLQFASCNLITAQHLFEVNHFTDIIVIDAQQAIEKTLKSIIAKLFDDVCGKLGINKNEITHA